MTTFITTVLNAVTCCHTGCGVQFGIEADYMARLRQTHDGFYCPNGHRQHFNAETEAERLKRQLQLTENCLTNTRNSLTHMGERARAAERSVTARKGVVTRMKRRLVAGRCICCSKQFKDLEAHMKTRHPKFDPEKGAQVLSEKSK